MNPDPSTAEGEACLMNIGPRERRKRSMVGVVGLVLGATVAAVLVILHMPRALRLLVFLPFAVGAAGVFQARAKT
jgi:hypothetical protein